MYINVINAYINIYVYIYNIYIYMYIYIYLKTLNGCMYKEVYVCTTSLFELFFRC